MLRRKSSTNAVLNHHCLAEIDVCGASGGCSRFSLIAPVELVITEIGSVSCLEVSARDSRLSGHGTRVVFDVTDPDERMPAVTERKVGTAQATGRQGPGVLGVPSRAKV